jgi:hypothetical protein
MILALVTGAVAVVAVGVIALAYLTVTRDSRG